MVGTSGKTGVPAIKKGKGMKFNGLEITTAIGCPNRCSYCPQDVLRDSYNGIDFLQFSDFCKCINKIPEDTHVYFSGFCEPWTNPDCTRMIIYAHRRGFKITVNTTLRDFTEADLNAIKDIPFHCFHVHLADESMKLNVDDEYLSILQSVYDSGIQNLYFRHHKPLEPRIVDIVSNPTKVDINSRAGNLFLVEKNSNPLKRCKNWGRHVMLPNGTVVLCCMDYGLKHKLGNLITGKWEDIHGYAYKEIIKGLDDPHADILCRSCVYNG